MISEMALNNKNNVDDTAKSQPRLQQIGNFTAKKLPNGWHLLINCQIEISHFQYVVIQPAAGVVLLEIDPVWTANASTIFQQHLADTGFSSRFPGHLPLIHRRMRPGDMAMLDMLLAEAFIWLDPISIDSDGGWEEALEALLTPYPPAETKAVGTTPPLVTLVADTRSPQPGQARLNRNGWIGPTAATLALTIIFFVPPRVVEAPIAPAMPPPSAAVAAMLMPTQPMPLAEYPPLLGDTAAEVIMHPSPPMPSNLPPEAVEPFQPPPPLPAPPQAIAASLPEALASLAPPTAMEGIEMLLPAADPTPIAAPNPPMAPPPPIGLPAVMAPPSAPERLVVPPLPPLPALASAPPRPSLPPPTQPLVRMSPAETETARRRGEALAALGDISGARRFLERAAAAGSGAAALAMAESFDPQKLAARGVIGLPPDRSAALTWYRHALALGVAEAAPPIARLEAE